MPFVCKLFSVKRNPQSVKVPFAALVSKVQLPTCMYRRIEIEKKTVMKWWVKYWCHVGLCESTDKIVTEIEKKTVMKWWVKYWCHVSLCESTDKIVMDPTVLCHPFLFMVECEKLVASSYYLFFWGIALTYFPVIFQGNSFCSTLQPIQFVDFAYANAVKYVLASVKFKYLYFV